MSIALKKIKLDRTEKEYFLFSRYENKKRLQVQVFNTSESKAYSGEITDLDLRSRAATIRMTYSNFLDDTLSSLTDCNSSNSQFLYALKQTGETTCLQWKKVIPEEDIKINLGEIVIYGADYNSVITDIFYLVSEDLFIMKNKVKELTLGIEESREAKEKTLSLLHEAVKVKEDMEKQMYAKFLLVINSKKEKIRSLKETIKLLESGNQYNKDVTVKDCSIREDRTSSKPNKSANKASKDNTKNVSFKRTNKYLLFSSEDESGDTEEDTGMKTVLSVRSELKSNSSLLLDDDNDTHSSSTKQYTQRIRKSPCSKEDKSRSDKISDPSTSKKKRFLKVEESPENLIDFM